MFVDRRLYIQSTSAQSKPYMTVIHKLVNMTKMKQGDYSMFFDKRLLVSSSNTGGNDDEISVDTSALHTTSAGDSRGASRADDSRSGSPMTPSSRSSRTPQHNTRKTLAPINTSVTKALGAGVGSNLMDLFSTTALMSSKNKKVTLFG